MYRPSLSRSLVRATLLMAIATCASLLYAGETDVHLTQEPTNALFQRSVFAHGYIHGYEEGFHWGNLDFQTGRTSSYTRESRAAKSTYDKTFGSRTRFKAGYHRGFRAGYNDGVHGREFRALDTAKQAVQDLSAATNEPKQLSAFDTGLSDGYDLGAVHGQNASRDNDDFDPTTRLCVAGAKEHPSHSPVYCSGFERGYTMGYSDGYVDSDPLGTTRAATSKQPQKP